MMVHSAQADDETLSTWPEVPTSSEHSLLSEIKSRHAQQPLMRRK